jgi:hypothetical protein
MLQHLVDGAKEELTEQGHVASGAGLKSLEAKIQVTPTGFLGLVLVEKYVLDLDQRQRPKVVPIGDLLKWASNVGNFTTAGNKLAFARRVQFSIARFGVPTPGSFLFTNNGRRTEWVKYGALRVEKRLDRLIDDPDFVRSILDDAIRQRP